MNFFRRKKKAKNEPEKSKKEPEKEPEKSKEYSEQSCEQDIKEITEQNKYMKAMAATKAIKLYAAPQHLQMTHFYSMLASSDIANFIHYLIKTRCERYNAKNVRFPAEGILSAEQIPNHVREQYKPFTLRIPNATYAMLEQDCKRYAPFKLKPDMLAQSYFFEGLIICGNAGKESDGI